MIGFIALFARVNKLLEWLSKIGPRVDVQSTRYGELLTTERSPQFTIESQNGPQELRDYMAQVDDTPLGGADVTRSNGEILVKGGTVSGESVKLQTVQNGEYSSSKQAQASLGYRRPDPPVDDVTHSWGAFNQTDGLGFREDSQGSSMFVRRRGSDRTVEEIKNAHPDAVFDGPADLDAIDKTQHYVYFVIYAWYGAGPVVWGYEKPERFDPTSPVRTSQVFAGYDPRRDPGLVGQYIDSPDMPVRVQIQNGGSSPSREMRSFVGGRQYALFGDTNPVRRALSQHFTFSGVSNGSYDPVVAIRPKSTFKGRENDVNLRIMDDIDFAATGECDLAAEFGADVSADNWNSSRYSGTDQSAFEIATASDNLSVNSSGVPIQPRKRISGGGGNKTAGRDIQGVNQPLGPGKVFLFKLKGVGNSPDAELTIPWTESF